MRLYRMTNSQGELVMIAPEQTLRALNLLSETEGLVLRRLSSGQKWSVTVLMPNTHAVDSRRRVEYQFEALPLEIPQAQSGLAEIAAPPAPPQTVERELVHVPEENESGCEHCE